MEKSEKTSLFSLLINLLLAFLKYLLGILSGSLALIADSIHSLSDVIGSMAMLIGLRISKRKSKSFPYGLYKVENLIAFISSLLILFAGYKIVLSAIKSENTTTVKTTYPVMIGIFSIIAIIYGFMRYEKKVARITQSPSIAADAEEYKTDLYAIFVILGSVLGNFLNLHFDKIASIVVSIFVFKAGGTLFVNAIRVLLDASVDFETLDKVKSIILEEPRVQRVKSLTGRNSGRYKFIEAEIILKVKELEKAHNISKKLEKRIKKSIPHVDHILIHYEPIKKEFINIAIPYEMSNNTISEHFGDAPSFLILKVKTDSKHLVKKDTIINPFLLEEKGKGIMVAELLVKNNVDVVVVKNKFHGRGPEYVFKDAEVQVKFTTKSSIEEIIKELGVKQ